MSKQGSDSLPFCFALGKRGATLSGCSGFAGLRLGLGVSSDVSNILFKKKMKIKDLNVRKQL